MSSFMHELSMGIYLAFLKNALITKAKIISSSRFYEVTGQVFRPSAEPKPWLASSNKISSKRLLVDT